MCKMLGIVICTLVKVTHICHTWHSSVTPELGSRGLASVRNLCDIFSYSGPFDSSFAFQCTAVPCVWNRGQRWSFDTAAICLACPPFTLLSADSELLPAELLPHFQLCSLPSRTTETWKRRSTRALSMVPHFRNILYNSKLYTDLFFFVRA
jgi:hypothetical protein